MTEKLKSISLSKKDSSISDGEHTVTFVASTSSEDRDYERVMIETFRLPVKGGGEIIVSDIPTEGTDVVDIPLLLNHNLMDVEGTIGSVRRAWFVNGELVFEAGISSLPKAQDVFKLIEEGHLDNSFSIQFRDYTANNNGELFGGEIVEVSVVTRGSNKDARVLATKGLKGEGMENPEVVVEPTTEAPVEVVETPTEVEDTVEKPVEEVEAVEETVETVEEVVEETPSEEAPAEAEKSVEAEETVEVEETPAEEISNEEIKEETMEKEIAKSLVVEAPAQAKSCSNYLASKSAMADFRDVLISTKGQGNQAVVKAWTANLEAKGVTGDAILPAQIEQIFFKTWFDNDSVLSTFRNINQNAAALYAFTGTGENIRAKGHKKGDTKANQVITNIRRDLKAKIIYKRLPIDLQDLLDDQSGELSAFRAEELARRVANEIVFGAILGDGRTAPESGADYRVFDGTRGLFSMAADIAAAAQGGYAGAVATEVANVASDNLYDKIVKTLAEVKDMGQGKVVVVPTGAISSLRLQKGSDGHYLFTPGSDVEAVIGARIVEMDEMDGAAYDVIAYANQGYALFASNEMVRTDFDTTNNEDIMLVERSVAGSLYGNRAAAGYSAS